MTTATKHRIPRCALLLLSLCACPIGSERYLAAMPGLTAPNPQFQTEPNELTSFVLRSDHPISDCRTPVDFIQMVSSKVRESDLGAGACVTWITPPNVWTGVVLGFRCPTRADGWLCSEIFEAMVWPVLAREMNYDPYVAKYSLQGISRRYRRCRRSDQRPELINEQAVRPTNAPFEGVSEDLFAKIGRVCRSGA